MRILLTLLVLCFSASAHAQETDMHTIPEGATLLNISATEENEIEQDLLIANMRIEERLKDASELQQEINKKMQAALNMANDYEGLEISTEQYYVHEEYRGNDDEAQNREPMWQATQSLQIKGTDGKAVQELSGKLQDMGFLMNGLSYTLSPDKHEESREAMLEDALKKLQARAQRVGTALGKPNTSMREVNVDAGPSSQPPRPQMMRAMAADSAQETTQPSARPGKSRISMTVSAKVILTP